MRMRSLRLHRPHRPSSRAHNQGSAPCLRDWRRSLGFQMCIPLRQKPQGRTTLLLEERVKASPPSWSDPSPGADIPGLQRCHGLQSKCCWRSSPRCCLPIVCTRTNRYPDRGFRRLSRNPKLRVPREGAVRPPRCLWRDPSIGGGWICSRLRRVRTRHRAMSRLEAGG